MSIKRALWLSIRYFFAAELFLLVANAFIWGTSFAEATIIAMAGGIAALPSATIIVWGIQHRRCSVANKFLATLVGITANTIVITIVSIAVLFHLFEPSLSLAPALCTIASICFCFKKQ